jgi:hypothetical protein
MDVKQVDAHESLSEIAYYSFTCPGCGDVERRLLTRRVPAEEILGAHEAQSPARPTPQEKLGRKEDDRAGRSAFTNLRHKSSAAQHSRMRFNEFIADPKQFIDAFVRNRGQKD